MKINTYGDPFILLVEPSTEGAPTTKRSARFISVNSEKVAKARLLLSGVIYTLVSQHINHKGTQ